MKIDIGKSFGSLIIILGLANAVSNSMHDDLVGFALSLFQMSLNTIFGLLYWKHVPSMLSITRIICRLSFILMPVILTVGFLSDKPLNFHLPFYEDKIDSTLGKISIILLFTLWMTAVYMIFSSKKAEIEFSSRVQI